MKTIHIEQEVSAESDPYQDLAIGVIKQAVDDYRSMKRKLVLPLNEEEKKTVEEEISSIRRFFHGELHSEKSIFNTSKEDQLQFMHVGLCLYARHGQ